MDVPIYNEILLSIFLVQEISSFDRTTLIPCLNPPHHPFLVRGASPLSGPIYLAVPVNQGTSLWQSRGLPSQGCEEQLLLPEVLPLLRKGQPQATLEIQARNCFKAHTRYDILSARHKPT